MYTHIYKCIANESNKRALGCKLMIAVAEPLTKLLQDAGWNELVQPHGNRLPGVCRISRDFIYACSCVRTLLPKKSVEKDFKAVFTSARLSACPSHSPLAQLWHQKSTYPYVFIMLRGGISVIHSTNKLIIQPMPNSVHGLALFCITYITFI